LRKIYGQILTSARKPYVDTNLNSTSDLKFGGDGSEVLTRAVFLGLTGTASQWRDNTHDQAVSDFGVARQPADPHTNIYSYQAWSAKPVS
jgi:hypothetical protein